MKKFKGQMYIEGTSTWTPEYDQWRRDNNVCNSPMAYALTKRAEKVCAVKGHKSNGEFCVRCGEDIKKVNLRSRRPEFHPSGRR